MKYVCKVCGWSTEEGKPDKCPICGTPLKLYQRITGYLRCIDNYNDGKKAEFDYRVQLKPED